MAFVAVYYAGVASGDQTKQVRSVPIRVGEADAQAAVAAADYAAFGATKVGLLLKALNDAQASDGTNAIKDWYVEQHYVNDAYAPPPIDSDPEIYNSNKIKLTYQTTNGGLPVTESIYITQRLSDLPRNSDGKSYDITQAPFVNMATQLIDTGLSSYNTPITALVSATPNDI